MKGEENMNENDKIFENEINQVIENTKIFIEKMQFRKAVNEAFY